MTAPAQAMRFLSALGYDATRARGLELRLLRGEETDRHWPTSLDIVWPYLVRANSGGWNVYFGVCPRDGKGGRKGNVSGARAVWVDLDAKDFDQTDHDNGRLAALDALHRALSPDMQPPILVDSGHGYHAYWPLREPVVFRGRADRERYESMLRGFYRYLGADTSVADVARVMRLPGTHNTKERPFVLCVLAECDPTRRFDLSDFEPYLLPEPRVERPKRPGSPHVGLRPGDRLASSIGWEHLLEPFGCRLVRVRGEVADWRRPGKAWGVSATTNYGGSDVLYVFSSNMPPFAPNRSYTKFHAYALLNHGGCFRRAARALRELGYGVV